MTDRYDSIYFLPEKINNVPKSELGEILGMYSL